MIDRLKEILIKEGYTSGSFADEIGVQRSSLSHILNGRNNPSLDFIIKTLTRFSDINPEWLLMGNGEMYKNLNEQAGTPARKSGSGDLFSSIQVEASKSEDIQIEDEEVKVAAKEAKEPDREVIMAEKPEKYVSQILIFYSDSTYQVYKPEKPGQNIS